MKRDDIVPLTFLASAVCHTFTKSKLSLPIAATSGIACLIKIGTDYICDHIDDAIYTVSEIKADE